jgi:hypothetical protein
MSILKKISTFFARGEELQVTYIDDSECAVRVFDDPRIGKVVRSKYGFTGHVAEVWRKPSGNETFVIEPPNGTRTYWGTREVEILSDAQIALIGHEKCIYCGDAVADEEEWGYATEYERELLLVGIIAMPNDILCAKCAEEIEAK